MKILTPKQGTSIKPNDKVKVILLDTPGDQPKIGIVMPGKVVAEQLHSNRHKLMKS